MNLASPVLLITRFPGPGPGCVHCRLDYYGVRSNGSCSRRNLAKGFHPILSSPNDIPLVEYEIYQFSLQVDLRINRNSSHWNGTSGRLTRKLTSNANFGLRHKIASPPHPIPVDIKATESFPFYVTLQRNAAWLETSTPSAIRILGQGPSIELRSRSLSKSSSFVTLLRSNFSHSEGF